ncbi:hypothetical protein B0T14DRAFT_606780 [Immersiella caudata]|uniref:Uncharacterized protein n=1 Tax=Immersiella caudata TaxID=314043 RepID=A0AA39WFP1_9PEZI|nr:hypothetical protein B0T14DRAFT_606780 [Immersiella caudata]
MMIGMGVDRLGGPSFYFEGNKPVGAAGARRPSVRVKLKPLSKPSKPLRKFDIDLERLARVGGLNTGAGSEPEGAPLADTTSHHRSLRQKPNDGKYPTPSGAPSIPTYSSLRKQIRREGKTVPSDISAIPPDRLIDGHSRRVSMIHPKRTDQKLQDKTAKRRSNPLEPGKSSMPTARSQPTATGEKTLAGPSSNPSLTPEQKKSLDETGNYMKKLMLEASGEGPLPDDMTTEPGGAVRRRRRKAEKRQRKSSGEALDLGEDDLMPPPMPPLPFMSEIPAADLGSTTRATVSSRETSKTDTPLPPFHAATARYFEAVDARRAAKGKAMLTNALRATQSARDLRGNAAGA